MLVGLGGVAVPLPVRETLHHFSPLLSLSLFLRFFDILALRGSRASLRVSAVSPSSPGAVSGRLPRSLVGTPRGIFRRRVLPEGPDARRGRFVVRGPWLPVLRARRVPRRLRDFGKEQILTPEIWKRFTPSF